MSPMKVIEIFSKKLAGKRFGRDASMFGIPMKGFFEEREINGVDVRFFTPTAKLQKFVDHLFIFSLSQWLNFKLSGITCLVGKNIRRLNGFVSGSVRTAE